ncbi:MAG: division/cell wall cluster transcriptional repressor MraZ [Patescibacteria group bacterium]|nr:division/cell wall cluster transcriptional repressor MraZ [Patescibacteria group bacterium]
MGKANMLIGEYKHTIDGKKRLAIPAKWRRELGRKVVLTHGLDNCLSVYPLKVWSQVSEKLAALSMGQADTRSFNRFMLAGAVEAEVDAMGRVLVPDFLKSYARLQSKVVLAGIHNRLEIWDESRWQKYKNAVEKRADALAQKLGEIGVF